MISKNKIKGKSKCAISLTERTFIHEIEDKYGLESESEISLQLFTSLKAFKIAIDPKYYGYQRGLASMVYRFFDKKSNGNGVVA